MPEFFKDKILSGLGIIPYLRSYGLSLDEISSLHFGKEYELIEFKEVKKGEYIFIFKKAGEEYVVKSEGYDLSLEIKNEEEARVILNIIEANTENIITTKFHS